MSNQEIHDAIAIHVMEWKTDGEYWFHNDGEHVHDPEYDGWMLVADWQPLEFDSQCMMVLDQMVKIAQDNMEDVYVSTLNGQWWCFLSSKAACCGELTPEGRRRAMCEAALRAVGKWEGE